MDGINHFFDGKIFADKLLSALAEFVSQDRIIRELQKFLLGGFNVAGADDEAGFIFQTNFIRTIKVVGDDGFAGGERLRQRARTTPSRNDKCARQSMMPT